MYFGSSWNSFLKKAAIFPLILFLIPFAGAPAKSQETDSFTQRKSQPGPMPCSFNGAKVGTSASLHSGVQASRCCPNCKGYETKRGTSINVKRGTPIVAIADMKLIEIIDYSAEQRSANKTPSGIKHGKNTYQKEDQKPFDDVQMFFIDKNGNIIFYYHLLDTHLVPGFKEGNCSIPAEYQWGKQPRLPRNCGGYSTDLIKNNFWVRKGDIIGTSGVTGRNGAHIGLGIAVPKNEKYRNNLLKNSKQHSPLKKSPHNIFAYPYTFTAKEMLYTAPQRDFLWEKSPTDSADVYLVPVMPKSFLQRKIETQNLVNINVISLPT